MSSDDDLDRYLRELPQHFRAKLRGTVRNHAQKLSAAQRQTLRSLQRAPDETGNLEASCRVSPGRGDLEAVVEAGGKSTTDATGYDHAFGFEFGTRKQPARPFFYSTARAMRSAFADEVSEAIDEVLK